MNSRCELCSVEVHGKNICPERVTEDVKSLCDSFQTFNQPSVNKPEGHEDKKIKRVLKSCLFRVSVYFSQKVIRHRYTTNINCHSDFNGSDINRPRQKGSYGAESLCESRTGTPCYTHTHTYTLTECVCWYFLLMTLQLLCWNLTSYCSHPPTHSLNEWLTQTRSRVAFPPLESVIVWYQNARSPLLSLFSCPLTKGTKRGCD